MQDAYLSVANVCKTFQNKVGAEDRLDVLTGVSFAARKGEIIGIVGPNGCGKTTLLLALAGLTPVDQGIITLAGQSVQDASVGLVFQNYRESLLPWKTVLGNIAFPLELAGTSKKCREQRVFEFVKDLGLQVHFENYPYQLSGGQQQLVAILRSLIQRPGLLLLDEPFSSLDYRARLRMHDIVQDVFLKTGQTVVLVSHELEEAILLSDRVLVLSNRPARVMDEFPINLERPRNREIVVSDRFLEKKRVVFDCFSRVLEEVTRDLP
jgi:NitT/TauT family transport system ATP-binding protein